MRITSQATLLHNDLWGHILLGKPYRLLPNTTLNEKFGILTKETPPPGSYPYMQYFCIGVGGDNIIDGDDVFNFSEHTPLDGALFEHIPFVMRKVSSDLTVEERADRKSVV